MATATKLVLPITGMSCSACSTHVEATLRATPGVTAASVSLLANQATVEGTATLDTLLAAVHDAGYEASAPTEASVPEEDESHLPLRAALALLAALVAMILSMPLMMASGSSNDPLLNAANRLLMPLMPSALMDLPATPTRVFLLVLTLAVMVFASPETYRRALAAARHRATNMNTLVAIGTLAALAYSTVATLTPGVFTRRGLAPDVYFEAVDFILAFLLLGAVLDHRAKRRTQSALAAFSRLQPATARVLRNGIETETPIADVLPGDTIQLRPGERIPVDGIVLTGSSTVDEALLTGESQPVLKSPGASVIGATINLDGPLTLRATTLGADSVLAQLHRLLAEAQSSRAPMQQLADRASAIFVPAILALAAVTFLLWLTFDHSLPRALSIAIAVLVIACPCAMGLAVPAALTVGIGRAAQLGILVKNGEALERLARTDTLAFDKTGTLTLGHPTIVSTTSEDPALLALAAALEQHSEHPLARAVLAYAPPAPYPALTDIKSLPGQGITAQHNGHPVAIGNTTLLATLNILQALQGAAEPVVGSSPAAPATTPLYLAVDHRHVLTLQATDTLRSTAAEAIQQLARLSITPHMLTGDTPATAAAIAAQTGITSIHASLLPADKLRVIHDLQQQGRIVAMAGDGLNDAAALAQADTGIAVASGTDLTRDAADLVLMSSLTASATSGSAIDLRAIPTAIRLARRTTRTMRQNLGWAVAYNALGLPIAAGVLYPHFHILLSPILASAAMALSSTSVLVNSLRLRRFH